LEKKVDKLGRFVPEQGGETKKLAEHSVVDVLAALAAKLCFSVPCR
jgi:hypothetical protein